MTEARLPKEFLWGFATAAYQIEGSYHQDGRQDSIWDVFCNRTGTIADGSNGNVACDSYNQFDKDITLLKSLGAKAYRLSISWSRVIPLGCRNSPVNKPGLDYYIKLVESLQEAGIEPIVTLYHWDLPEVLDQRYGGLLGKEDFIQDFLNYANVMFDALGTKVKYWITFNEPWCSAILGYHAGIHAPGRSSDRTKSPKGDGTREPWIVGHNLLLAHANAVKLYREEYAARCGGMIAITLNGDWVEPWDSTDAADIDACQRKLEFSISWFADPIYLGKYPDSMIKQLGDRLPTFTAEESSLLKGSNDYYGMNHYCANYIKHKLTPPEKEDIAGNLELLMENKLGESIGPETQSTWLRPYPLGFRKLLKWLSDRYDRPKIFVTENGTSIKGENDKPQDQILNDDFRVWYFKEYIQAMVDSRCEDGVNVIGYLAWSLLDNFEWADGYETRFGVTFVDYQHEQERHPKKSARMIGQVFNALIKT